MSINYKNIFLFSLVLFLFSTQTFALGERVAKLADNVGKKVGLGMTAAEINRDADAALAKLLKTTPAAAELAKKAKAILVFPKILKAGLMVGGQHGEGALKKNGKTIAYYSTFAGSYGLQAGAQSFSFTMFFMDDEALKYLNSSDGWEVGVGPSIVIVDDGMAKSMTSMSMKESVYVFSFGQGGLMAGAGIQGSKITKINPQK